MEEITNQESSFSVSIPKYNFSSQQRKDETIKDFKVRVQEELDRLNIPVEVA